MLLCPKSISGFSDSCCQGPAHFLSTEIVVGEEVVCSMLAQLILILSGNPSLTPRFMFKENVKAIEINAMN